jgi:Alpha/beta hydrolase domain
LAKCEATHTCPVAAEVYSANEYWVKAASLLHTTPDGRRDLPDSRYARNYFLSSLQHGTGNPTTKGVCQQFMNPLDAAPVLRGLFVALDDWADDHRSPPSSRVPRLHKGTLSLPLPQARVGFPNIPGVTYTGLKTTRYLFDYGPHYYSKGIPTINPPLVSPPFQANPANGPIYPSYVPRTDADGNDIAGVRLVDVTVPLATYTGWALRAGAQANDGCEAAGQFIPFAKTQAERAATGDPRPSVAERYASFEHYRHAVLKAMDKLVARRFLLCEDTASEQTRLFNQGIAAGVPAPASTGRLTPVTLPHCAARRGHGDGHNDHDDEDDDDRHGHR